MAWSDHLNDGNRFICSFYRRNCDMKHGKLYWLSVVATMLIAVGCDESSTSTICTDNTWNCDDNVLYQCVSGNWKSVKKCHEGTTCNQGAAACIEDETRDAQCLANEHIFAEQCEPDDVNHCGSHFNDCAKMAGWKSGKCIDKTCIAIECATGYHLANRTNADSKAIAICDEDTHDACGSANLKCDADQICTQGVCSNTCQFGEVVCKGSCINPETNAKYCGADASCLNYTACSETEQCIAGKCVISSCTNPEESLCREDGQRICVNINGDNPKHCGGCGAKCNENELCQNGQCVINSCVENACLYNNACINRTDKCGKQCMNCNSDNHALTGLCQDGTCITLSCVDGYHLYENTCEADSLEHCGAHGNACNVEGATNICANGMCSFTCKEGYVESNGSCLPVMISTWEVTSNNLNVVFPIQGRAGTVVIDWGDDTRSEIASGNAKYISHTYLNAGIYVITVFGTIEKWSCCEDLEECREKKACDGLLSIRSFGNVAFGRNAFAFTQKLESLPTQGTVKFYKNDAAYAFYRSSFNNDISGWDTSSITNMSHMFQETSAFNQPIENWNVSNVTDMSYMFAGHKYYRYDGSIERLLPTDFNQPLNNWNVSNVTNMKGMFSVADEFNQPLENWDVSNVTDMSAMFEYAESFNQPLNNWDVSNVTDMNNMFSDANRFNHSLNKWNVSNVTDMDSMFYSADAFNQPLENWNVSNVTNMSFMFAYAEAFNRPLNNWNVSNVTNMSYMFSRAYKFNQPLENWNVSNVTNMEGMFLLALAFNQPLENWNVSNVTNMSHMFHGAWAFNQPIENWNVSNVTDMFYMFSGASAFNQPIENWDVSNVTDMFRMFSGASTFNQPLNNWNVSNVTDMSNMFSEATAFNQPLNNWDVSNVTDMFRMFSGASTFNQPLNKWNVSNVTDMEEMFKDARAFNQPLNNWDVSEVWDMRRMFSGASAFNQPLNNWNVSNVAYMGQMFSDSGLNQENYCKTVKGGYSSEWSKYNLGLEYLCE